jgi:predicted nuclease of predicted toxin-antitoxin system
MSTVRALRMYGHEVVHLSEEHLERLLDPAILEKARQEERLVLTFDLDFGELLATGVHALPSVILLRMRDQTPSSVTARLLEVLSERRGELIAGASSCRTHVTGCAGSRSGRLKVGRRRRGSMSLHLGPSRRSDV